METNVGTWDFLAAAFGIFPDFKFGATKMEDIEYTGSSTFVMGIGNWSQSDFGY